LVVDQRREARGIGRRHQRFDLEVAAIEHELDIAHRQRLGADYRDVDGKLFADQTARVLDPLLSVERVADRQRMDDRPLRPDAALIHCAKNPLNVSDLNLLRAEIDGCREGLGAEAACRDVDHDRLDRQSSRTFGHANDGTDGLLGLVEIGDHAALDAARGAIAEADDLGGVGPPLEGLALGSRREARDHAANLGRADIEHRDQRRLARLHGLQPRGHHVGDHCALLCAARSAAVSYSASPPLAACLFFFLNSAHAWLARSPSFSDSIPGTRMSMTSTSRSRSWSSVWYWSSWLSACAVPFSGSCTRRPE